MRQTLVTLILLGMLIAAGVLLSSRGLPTLDAPAATAENTSKDGANDKKASPKTSTSESKNPETEKNTEAKGDQTPPADAPQALNRPLRVISLGWEISAPAVLANGGRDKPASDTSTDSANLYTDDLKVSFETAAKPVAVEEALARGGAAKDGADIAIIALPTFVASFEKLRALSPKMFFIAGWSRGREGMAAASMDALGKATKSRKTISLRGERATPATFLSLFMLGEAGVETRSVELADPSDIMGPRATFAAIDRSRKGHTKPGAARKILLTTADAAHLIPFVAVAPEGFLRKHPDVINAWMEGWMKGTSALRSDVPKAARQIAKLSNAPEELDLLNLLGLLQYTSIYENVRLMGLSGREPVTLEKLFQRTWNVWRASDVLTTPAPEAVPMDTRFVAQLARSSKDLGPKDQGGTKTRQGGKEALLTVHLPGRTLDESRLHDEVAFLAGVFGKSILRVTIPRDRKQAKTQKALSAISERFRIPSKRLEAGTKMSGKGSAQIEVLYR